MEERNMPYIGTNGNWYVENEDTGVTAQGSIGHQGPVGPQGEIGPAGETGDRGPQGFTGPKGEKGDAGPQGVQGIQGPEGLQGSKGDTGETGVQGPKGEKGDKGDIGPQGPIGATPALATNLTTTVAGSALDATMGKVLNDKTGIISSNLGGLKFYENETGKYVVGADSVPKKLGDSISKITVNFYYKGTGNYPTNGTGTAIYTKDSNGAWTKSGTWTDGQYCYAGLQGMNYVEAGITSIIIE